MHKINGIATGQGIISYVICTFIVQHIMTIFFCVDDAKCEVITCTHYSSYAVTDRGKVCNFTNMFYVYYCSKADYDNPMN